MNDQLLQIMMRAVQLRNYYQKIGAVVSFKAELILKYKKDLLEKILSCIWMDNTDLNSRLENLLADNWGFVKNTILCYTAMPEDDLTLLLCDIATQLKNSEQSALLLLMPGITIEAAKDGYPDLSEIEIKQVLKTHVISSCSAYLLPVSLLLELNIESGNNVQIFNPYYNYELGEQGTHIDQRALHRLFDHSNITRALKEARQSYHDSLMDSPNLFSRLIRLTESFYLNGVEGIGTEFETGQGVFDEIIRFVDYFERLGNEQKERIPEGVQKQIDIIIALVRDPSANAAAGIETCVSVRRNKLKEAMHGHDTLLKQIGLTQVTRDQGLSGYDQIFKDSQNKLREKLLNNYTGNDHLPLNIELFQRFDVHLVVNTLEDLNDLMLFETEELANILPEDSIFCKMISKTLNNIEALTLFLKELPDDKFAMILNRIISIFQRMEARAYFLSSLDSTKFMLVAKQFFNQPNANFHELFRYLSSEQCYLLLEKLPNIDVNMRDSMGNTLLHTMLERQFTEVAKKLLTFESIKINERNSQGVTPLLLACYEGHVEIVSILLTHSVDVGQDEVLNTTPLSMACQEGRVEVVRALLEHSSIEINKKNGRGATPLSLGCQNGHIEVVRVLLTHSSIKINKANIDGATSLFVACQEGHTEVVRVLLAHSRIEVNKGNNAGVTPLFMACQNGHTEVVRVLLEHSGVDVNKENINRGTPLFMACQNGHTEVVSVLLTHPSIEVNKARDTGTTPLLIACQNGHIEVIDVLLAHSGIEINEANLEGATPLFMACQNGHIKVVNVLLEHSGVEVNKGNNAGATPLFMACQNGHTEVVSVLLTHPSIEVNKARDTGATPLFMACQNGHIEVINVLLAHPSIEINEANIDGATPLFMACQEGHTEVVKALLEHSSIDVNKGSNTGATPLFMACQNGHIEVINVLLAHPSIEINEANIDGATPLFMACQEGHTEVVKALLEHSSIDVNKGSNTGVTPLFMACQDGHTEVVSVLLTHPSIEVNKARDTGATPLFMACQNGHIEVINVLLAHPSIEINKANIDGATPLFMACQEGHTNIVEILLKHSKIDVDQKNTKGDTALDFVSKIGHIDIVALLHKHKEINFMSSQNRGCRVTINESSSALLGKRSNKNRYFFKENSDVLSYGKMKHLTGSGVGHNALFPKDNVFISNVSLTHSLDSTDNDRYLFKENSDVLSYGKMKHFTGSGVGHNALFPKDNVFISNVSLTHSLDSTDNDRYLFKENSDVLSYGKMKHLTGSGVGHNALFPQGDTFIPKESLTHLLDPTDNDRYLFKENSDALSFRKMKHLAGSGVGHNALFPQGDTFIPKESLTNLLDPTDNDRYLFKENSDALSFRKMKHLAGSGVGHNALFPQGDTFITKESLTHLLDPIDNDRYFFKENSDVLSYGKMKHFTGSGVGHNALFPQGDTFVAKESLTHLLDPTDNDRYLSRDNISMTRIFSPSSMVRRNDDDGSMPEDRDDNFSCKKPKR